MDTATRHEAECETAPEVEDESAPTVMRIVEDIVGCKWTLMILGLIRKGVNRPGAIQRAADGLTTKVMNERLSKMTRYGILERMSYAEVVPRVEYSLTKFGLGFIGVLDAIEELERMRN